MSRVLLFFVGIGLSLSLGFKARLKNNANELPLERSYDPVIIQPERFQVLPTALPMTSGLESIPHSSDRTHQPYKAQITIGSCNSVFGNANFRESPRMNSGAILGEVMAGNSVKLTGRIAEGDGITWYEAIAPELLPSRQIGAINQTQANQIGWIASCFVN